MGVSTDRNERIGRWHYKLQCQQNANCIADLTGGSG